MSKNDQRDEFLYRLSSFLYQGGKLELKEISFIKARVFYIETHMGEPLILKGHSREEIVVQQWDFFEKIQDPNVVSFKHFPNGQKIITNTNNYWTISPFINGEKLNYKINEDRNKVVKTLKEFHNNATDIHVHQPVYKKQFFVRWYQRLQSFKKTEHLFIKHGFESLYKDIVQTTVIHLRLLEQFPWHFYEKEAKQKGQWIHGDVASHNFIRNKNTYVIDFDLLQCTPQIYDYIQLGQRFLPYINWNIDELLSYKMVNDSNLKPWLYAIFVPSDLLREWIFFLKKNGSSTAIYQYLSQMEETMISRSDFLKNAKLMLKSL